MSVRIFFDPFRLVIESAEALWPAVEAEVVFTPESAPDAEDGLAEAACGYTTFPTDGGAPEVVLSSDLPYSAAVEILAHELAHVAVGPDAEHGPEWEAAFAAIHAEYERRLETIPGGRLVETGRPR